MAKHKVKITLFGGPLDGHEIDSPSGAHTYIGLIVNVPNRVGSFLDFRWVWEQYKIDGMREAMWTAQHHGRTE